MSARIENTFAQLKAGQSRGLITFIMAGDPDLATTQKLLDKLPQSGADIIEIGMPFSDPMADGPTIQAAGLRALASGTKLKNVISTVASFRKKNNETPIVLMGYYNPVYHYGVEKFCLDANKAGVDGVILVDLPPEEEDEFVTVAKPHGLKFIRLIAPTTNDARLTKLVQNAGGFLYYIAVAGVTGTKSADINKLSTRAQHIASQTKLPIAVGFGIRTPQQAAATAKCCDAVVVGSALVEEIAKNGLDAGLRFVQNLSQSIKNS
jgi:tryptophan synthase alpha chain